MAPNMSLFSVNAILLLSTDDHSRILAKYYNPPHIPAGTHGSNYPGANPYPTVKEQKAFEKGLLEKTAKQTSDVILYDNRVVVFKVEGDVMLYVVGGAEENEIMLYSVVLALRDSLNILLKYACTAMGRKVGSADNVVQKPSRQAHADRELRPRLALHRRDCRRRHHPRDGPCGHCVARLETAGARRAQYARLGLERGGTPQDLSIWQAKVGREITARSVSWACGFGRVAGRYGTAMEFWRVGQQEMSSAEKAERR